MRLAPERSLPGALLANSGATCRTPCRSSFWAVWRWTAPIRGRGLAALYFVTPRCVYRRPPTRSASGHRRSRDFGEGQKILSRTRLRSVAAQSNDIARHAGRYPDGALTSVERKSLIGEKRFCCSNSIQHSEAIRKLKAAKLFVIRSLTSRSSI